MKRACSSSTASGRSRLHWLAAVALSLGTAASVSGACEPGLTVWSFPEGRQLTRVALAPGAPAFALSFLHSVSLTPVESRYVLDADGIRQTAEVFETHGAGLPSLADEEPGARWDREGDRFLLHLQRPIPRLVVRVAVDARNRLTAGARGLDLTQWGDRALEIVPLFCPPP